jgi:hypothetical protein
VFGGTCWRETHSSKEPKITTAQEWIETQCEETGSMLGSMGSDKALAAEAIAALRRAFESALKAPRQTQ